MRAICCHFTFIRILLVLLSAAAKTNGIRIPTLVSTDALHQYLQNYPDVSRHVRVLESSFNPNTASSYTTEYAQGHIPQAVYFDLNKCVRSTVEIPRNLPELKCITDYIRILGVWPNTHVVIYSRSSPFNAFRLWWTFRLLGHRKVSVLDGGYWKWIADGYNTSTSIPLVERSMFEGKLDKTLLRTYSDMVENVVTKREQVIDARPLPVSGMTSYSGMLPDAKVVAFTKLFNNDGTMKNMPELKKIFEGGGVNLTQPMVSYCHTGMSATALAAAAHVLGLDIPVYYGSWNEWRRRWPEQFKPATATV